MRDILTVEKDKSYKECHKETTLTGGVGSENILGCSRMRSDFGRMDHVQPRDEKGGWLWCQLGRGKL